MHQRQQPLPCKPAHPDFSSADDNREKLQPEGLAHHTGEGKQVSTNRWQHRKVEREG